MWNIEIYNNIEIQIQNLFCVFLTFKKMWCVFWWSFIIFTLLFTGHIQIAQVPNRDEPGCKGEIDYSYVFKLLEDVGYDGCIGLEYNPKGTSDVSWNWNKNCHL